MALSGAMVLGNGQLAVVIAARNEAEHLPLLLADLWAIPSAVAELVVVDGGSGDASRAISQLAGARVLPAPACRGAQLALGAAQTTAPWLLFLHADGRLEKQWARAIEAAIAGRYEGEKQTPQAWYFALGINAQGLGYRLLEGAVALRSKWRQLPYGDQGLLIKRTAYEAAGGFAPLALMEDLDFVQRLRQKLGPQGKLRCLGPVIRVSGRRWQRQGVWQVSWQNWQLRRAWRRGTPSETLAGRYYR